MLRIAYLGDIVGTPGRQAVAQQMPVLRERYRPDLVIANAENAANGSGLTPSLFDKILGSGIDACTLGDHAYRKKQIVPRLESSPNLIRPFNLPAGAKGKGIMKLTATPGTGSASGDASSAGAVPVYVVVVLGRLFINALPQDEPFGALERALQQVTDPRAVVLVEAHCEATSESVAIGHYLAGRVAGVVGTHTHIPTADARVLPPGTAYITDLGMCGAQHSVLGRQVEPVLQQMTTAMPAPFDVATEDPRVCGVLIEIDEQTRRAQRIERIELAAQTHKPPFVA